MNYQNTVRKLAVGACAVVGAVLALPTTGLADVLYAVQGRRGVVTYTTRKPQEGARYRVFTPGRGAFSSYSGRYSSWRVRGMKSRYDSLIYDAAQYHGLDPALVKAVVHVESAFNPWATSPKGAMGLMQLMPKTARRFRVRDAYRPEQNVTAGTRYLKWLHQRYNGDLRLALAAYNAGEGTVDKLWDIPPYRETQDYVRRVLKAREIYRCDYSGKRSCPS